MTGDQVLGATMSLVGTVIAADQARALDEALRSRGWPSTQGRIIEQSMLRMRSPVGPLSSPAILYEYTVDGETYQAQTLNYRGSVTLGAALGVLRYYRKGRRVTVYYDPKNPARAVLERGASVGGLVRVILGGLVVWLGLRIYYGGGG